MSGRKHQLTVPPRVLEALGLVEGQDLWVALNPDKPGTFLVMTEAVASEVWQRGWNAP